MIVAIAVVLAVVGVGLLSRKGAHPVLDKELAPPGSDVLDLSGRRLP